MGKCGEIPSYGSKTFIFVGIRMWMKKQKGKSGRCLRTSF